MTTAHKPTFHPAIGTANQGGYRYVVPRQQFSSRDLPGQLDLKIRQPGQNTTQEIAQRDLKAELDEREAQYYEKKRLEKQRQGLLPEPAALESGTNQTTLALTYEKELAAFDDSDDDDSDSSDDEDSELDSEDEEKALMAELAAIKKEKALQKAKKEAEEAKLREEQEQNAMIQGNPLIKNKDGTSKHTNKSGSFALKRSWVEDTVFKNQAPEPKRQKRFINDTIRSDFHR
eukprot:311885_1